MNRAIQLDLLDESVFHNLSKVRTLSISSTAEKTASKQKRKKKKEEIYMRTSDQLEDEVRWKTLFCIPCRCVRMDAGNRYRPPPLPPNRPGPNQSPESYNALALRPFRFQRLASPHMSTYMRPILHGVHSASTRYQDTSTNYPLFPYAKSYGPPSTYVTSPRQLLNHIAIMNNNVIA